MLQTTAKNHSKSNKVERLHRTINEYLRTHASSTILAFDSFKTLVNGSVAKYNTTPYKGKSCHSKVFTFPSNCERLMPIQIRPEYEWLVMPNISKWPKGFDVGQKVLLKNLSTTKTKLDPRFEPTVIAERVGPHQYRLEGKPGKFDIEHPVPVPTTTLTQKEQVEDASCPPLPPVQSRKFCQLQELSCPMSSNKSVGSFL